MSGSSPTSVLGWKEAEIREIMNAFRLEGDRQDVISMTFTAGE